MIGHSFAKIGIAFAILVMSAARPATAQVVSIRSGTLIFDGFGAGELDISGNQGFTLQARMIHGINDPYTSCSVDCVPGETVAIHVRSVGGDLPGVATLRGKTYTELGATASPSSADIMITGRIAIPPVGDAPVSVSAPFDFAGELLYARPDEWPPHEARLIGGGRVTFQLVPVATAEGMEWSAASAVFEFLPVKRRR